MKKTLSAFCALWITAALSALPIGNPWEASLHRSGVFFDAFDLSYSEPSWLDPLSLRIGYSGDFVYDRHLQTDEREAGGSIHRSQITTNAAYLVLNFFDSVDLFSALGSSNFTINTPATTFGVSLNQGLPVTIDTNTHFSWSLGLRGTLWEYGYFGIGAEAQYFNTRPTINSLHFDLLDTVYFSSRHAKYQEWQLGIGASYRINIAGPSTALVPYLGIKWSKSRMKFNTITTPLTTGGSLVPGQIITLRNLENERNFGYAFGVTLVGCNKASVTVEGRFRDEQALYVNAQFRL